MATAAPTTPPKVDEALRRDVDDFWHYSKIARYDLAVAAANKVMERKDRAEEVLRAFESVSEDHKDNMDARLLHWQGVDPLRDAVNKLMGVIQQGRLRGALISITSRKISRCSA